MKAEYTPSLAKERVRRNGLRFEGEKIVGDQPGIKVWGAIDYLTKQGYKFFPEIHEKTKEKALDRLRK